MMIGAISVASGGLGAATAAVAVLCGAGALWYAAIGVETLQLRAARAPVPVELASLAAADSAAQLVGQGVGDREEAARDTQAAAMNGGERGVV
jgi:hypothetical protein